ncbi:MAG: class I SAM-dependent methyltransferase [Proteobacteria bacterium]|nr:class I SAM-dependent methyltransferase [Pseudomonadota bacterium]
MRTLFNKLTQKIQSVMSKDDSDILAEAEKEKYENRIHNELNFYKDCHNVHDLPKIFHYWSNKYLLPMQEKFGFSNPDHFFWYHCEEYCLEHIGEENRAIKILSIGSGNGELEVKIASVLSQNNNLNFSIECMDINQDMLDRTVDLARKQGVDKKIKITKNDFNKWNPDTEYDIILANQSLHHVMELEHLFDAIHAGLKQTGLFMTSDMIGRNGHMRWPEALEVLEPFWAKLPEKHKYNQLMKRQENTYINHDCSTEGFEGIRAQDILRLLTERFNFKLFIPFANIIMVFIDRPFGHNFDVKDPKDLDFIDQVHKKDEELILNGSLKPTQLLAIMTKDEVAKTKLSNPLLTPEFCIRKP